MPRKRCPNGTRKRVCSVRGRDVTDCANPCSFRQSKKISALRKLLNEKDDSIQKLKTQERQGKAARKAYKTLKRQNAELYQTNAINRRRIIKQEKEMQTVKSALQELEQSVPPLIRDCKVVKEEKDQLLRNYKVVEKERDEAIQSRDFSDDMHEQCEKEVTELTKLLENNEKKKNGAKNGAILRKKFGKLDT